MPSCGSRKIPKTSERGHSTLKSGNTCFLFPTGQSFLICGGNGSGTKRPGDSCVMQENTTTIWNHSGESNVTPCPKAEEQIINVKNTTGRQALDSLYDVITNGLTFQLDSRNGSQPLSREQLAVHFRNPSARVRQRAYDELFQVYSKQSNSLGDIYKTLVMDWKNEGLDLRGYSSPIAVRKPSQRHSRQSGLHIASNLSRQPARVSRIFSNQSQDLRFIANDSLRRVCTTENQKSFLSLRPGSQTGSRSVSPIFSNPRRSRAPRLR